MMNVMGMMKYFDLPSDQEIVRRIMMQPEPLVDLARYDVGEGCLLIEAALKKVFMPSDQIVGLIRHLVGMARAHFATTYTDEAGYRETCYRAKVAPDNPWNATALTGLGGTGKTLLVRAISRLLTSEGAMLSLPEMPSYPIELVWLLTMRQGTTLEALLRQLVPDLRKGADILTPVAKHAFTNFVCLAILDESQFISSTQAAHALAGKIIMKLMCVGPPALYCANYTMLNKLCKRPQQERDRILSNVLVLMPEPLGSKDYERVIEGQLKIFGSATESDKAVSAAKYADKIHSYVFGINRKSAILFEIAWSIARSEGSALLKFSHVEKAYMSDRFLSHRNDVEILQQQALDHTRTSDDLWCDFAPPAPTNVIAIPSLGEEKMKRTGVALSRSTLTKEERDAYDALRSASGGTAAKKATVVKLPKAERTLAALQRAGATLLDEH